MKSLFLIFFALPFVLLGNQKSLEPDQVARLDGEILTLQDYKDFLYLTLAQSRLDDLLEYRLLKKEATRLGLVISPERLQRELVKEVNDLLHQRFSGDRERMAKNMVGRGYTMQEMERWMAFDLEKRLLQERVILASRKITPDQIKRKFDDLYGLDGVRVTVRQIQISFAPILEKELAGGISISRIDRAALEKKTLEKAMRIWKRVADGKNFIPVCLDESDEAAAKAARGNPRARARAGLVRNYNYQQFGGEFADAVRNLEEGRVSPPVAFKSSGNLLSYHIIRVEKRTTTSLDKVRDRVISILKTDRITFYEKLALKQKLLGSAQVVTRAGFARQGKKGIPGEHQHR